MCHRGPGASTPSVCPPRAQPALRSLGLPSAPSVCLSFTVKRSLGRKRSRGAGRYRGQPGRQLGQENAGNWWRAGPSTLCSPTREREGKSTATLLPAPLPSPPALPPLATGIKLEVGLGPRGRQPGYCPCVRGQSATMGLTSPATRTLMSPFYRKGKRVPEKKSTWEGLLAGLAIITENSQGLCVRPSCLGRLHSQVVGGGCPERFCQPRSSLWGPQTCGWKGCIPTGTL